MFRAELTGKINEKTTARQVVRDLLIARRLATSIGLDEFGLFEARAQFLAHNKSLSAEDRVRYSCTLPPSIHQEVLTPGETYTFGLPPIDTNKAAAIINRLVSDLPVFLNRLDQER